MKTSKLIHSLSSQLRPVRPIKKTGTRFSLWGVLAVCATGVLVGIFGVGNQLGTRLEGVFIYLEFIFLLGLVLLCGWGALKLSVPGDERKAIHWVFPLSVLFGWVIFGVGHLFIAFGMGGISAGGFDFHLSCAILIFSFGIMTGAPLVYLVRKAYPLSPVRAGLLAGLASAAAPAVGITLICDITGPGHLLIWHTAPVLFMGFLAAGMCMRGEAPTSLENQTKFKGGQI